MARRKRRLVQRAAELIGEAWRVQAIGRPSLDHFGLFAVGNRHEQRNAFERLSPLGPQIGERIDHRVDEVVEIGAEILISIEARRGEVAINVREMVVTKKLVSPLGRGPA